MSAVYLVGRQAGREAGSQMLTYDLLPYDDYEIDLFGHIILRKYITIKCIRIYCSIIR